ncbi:MAG: DUF1684 domain-containing protein [Candidatus Hodarchaeales archaeon]
MNKIYPTQKHLPKDLEKERIEVEKEREEKDIFNLTHNFPESLLRDDQKLKMPKLKYFPYNQDLLFNEIVLHEYPDPKESMILKSSDGREGIREVKFTVLGYFLFNVQGQECKLNLYSIHDDKTGQTYYSIPFKDNNSGKKTYGGGRYLYPVKLEEKNGIFKLDFNRAINPKCAYNTGWSCLLPPPDNWLNVSIDAGEMIYPAQEIWDESYSW